MSSRLVLGFMALTLVLTTVLILVRSSTLASELRNEEAEHVRQEASMLGVILRDRVADGQRVDAALLDGYVDDEGFISVSDTPDPPVTVTGSSFDPSTDTDDAVSGYADLRPGTLEVGQAATHWRGVVGPDPPSLVMLMLLIAAVAALGGYAMSRWLSEPFTRLSAAAGMLGRGRFDLDLPPSRIPEAQSVGTALQASATALRDRLAREQSFSTHASHVLRTPLTGLRLHLDELAERPLDCESVRLVDSCQSSVDQLDQVAGDLVAISRGGSLVSGSEIPLRDVAKAAAQRWADVLLQRGRSFSAAVEGDLDLLLTPGPVEYVLDVLLERAQAAPEACDVRLVLLGRPEVLRLDVSGLDITLDPPDQAPGPAPDPGADAALCRVHQAASLIRSLGGRLETPSLGAVRVLIPPR